MRERELRPQASVQIAEYAHLSRSAWKNMHSRCHRYDALNIAGSH